MRNGRIGAAATALFIVAIMLTVPMTAFSGSDADTQNSFLPEGGDYGYILKYDDNNTRILDVLVWNGEEYVSTMPSGADGNMGDNVVLNSFWDFDRSTGLGPFNVFYAAINLTAYTESTNPDFRVEAPISMKAGEIAYVLDPENITSKTLAGNGYSKDKYNIMLIVPTVYWYSDATTGCLYLSNDKGFFTDDKSAEYTAPSDSMFAYAHTFSSDGNKKWSTDRVYPYLALGVYEGSVKNINGSNKLLSKAGETPKVDTSLGYFRIYAKNNETTTYADGEKSGYYGIWNFYGWSLYKMMAYTIMGSKDSQYVMGMGVVGGVDGNRVARQSTGSTSSAYEKGTIFSEKATKGTKGVSILLENTWGNVGDYIDDFGIRNKAYYTGNYLQPTTIGNSKSTGVGSPGGGCIVTMNKSSELWDVPASTTSKSGSYVVATGAPAKTGGAAGYDYGVNDTFSRENTNNWQQITAGGNNDKGSIRGTSYLMCVRTETSNTDYWGARLSYVMNAPYTVDYKYGDTGDSGSGSLPASLRCVPGQEITVPGNGTITNADPLKKFIGWMADDVIYSPGEKFVVHKNSILKSYWAYPVITVKFDGNGDTTHSMEDQTIGFDTRTRLKANVYDMEGYSFYKWIGTGVEDGKTYEFNDRGEVDIPDTGGPLTIKLVAQWMGNFTLVFDAAGGSEPAPPEQTVMATKTIILPDYNGSKSGNRFIGWGYDGKVYAAYNPFTMPSSNVILTAEWKKTATQEVEDDDDILELLRRNQVQHEAQDRTTLDMAVIIAAVALCVASCLVIAVWKKRSTVAFLRLFTSLTHVISAPSPEPKNRQSLIISGTNTNRVIITIIG